MASAWPRASILLVISAVSASALAGCGGSSSDGIASKPAAQIFSASRAAALAASSVNVLSTSGHGPAAFSVDFQLALHGGRTSLRFLNLSYEAIRIGDTLYVRGNRVFNGRLEHETGVHLAPGAWLKGPVTSPKLASLAALTNLHSELALILNSDNPFAKGSLTTIHGKPAVVLTEHAKLYTGTLYIPTTGSPYPIRLQKSGRAPGEVTFTGWNQTLRLTAPANAVTLPAAGSATTPRSG